MHRDHGPAPHSDGPRIPYYQVDELTRLPNRQWLNVRLEELCYQRPGGFAVVMVDLDGLKEINDTSADKHEAGDEYIKAAADALSLSVRKKADNLLNTDSVIMGASRYGGDEFIVLLEGINNQEDLEVVLARIKSNFAESKVRASMGAAVHTVGQSKEEILADVDQKLYEDKKANKAARQSETLKALPLHKRLSYYAGKTLVGYSGVRLGR